MKQKHTETQTLTTQTSPDSFWRGYFFKLPRILKAAFRGFIHDNIYLNASALTFYSLLSIVPVLAVAFGIAKGFGFQDLLETLIRQQFVEYELLVNQVINFAYSLLEQARGGLIAGIGVVALFWAVVRLLSNIEDAFNGIWKIEKSRSFTRKVSDYLAAMVICPLFFIASSSMTVYLTTQVSTASLHSVVFERISPVFFVTLRLLPFILTWMLFTFMYLFMPNKKVDFNAGLLAGIIAGTAFQILQMSYIYFQLKVSNYGAIYGSFAALPLFLIWLQLSWILVLGGAEIAYFAEGNRFTYTDFDRRSLSFASRKQIAVKIVSESVDAFTNGNSPPSASVIARKLDLPIEMIQEILEPLIAKHVLSESSTGGIQPAIDPNLLTSKKIYNALETWGRTV